MSEAPDGVGIQRGEGAVARLGAAAVVVGPGPDLEPWCAALLELLSGADGGPPEAVVWRLAGLVTSYRENAPAFGAVVRVANGFAVLLHGSVRAMIDTDGGSEFTGESSITWTEHFVADPIQRISVTVAGGGTITADPRSDLRAGLVPGAGFVLTLRAAGAPPEAFEPAGASQPEPPSIPPEPPRQPDPVPTPSRPIAPPEPVPGVTYYPPPPPSPPVAPSGQRAHETMVVPAASAALVADDGKRTPLDRDYVFGREPWNDPAVTDGHASPIVVRDPDNLVSRVQVHVMVMPADGVVVVRDVSANGTFVAPPGAPEWMPLSREPVALPPGWSLLMGSRVFTYSGPS